MTTTTNPNMMTNAPEGAVAWKFAGPLWDGRYVFDRAEAEAIEREDPTLIQWGQRVVSVKLHQDVFYDYTFILAAGESLDDVSEQAIERVTGWQTIPSNPYVDEKSSGLIGLADIPDAVRVLGECPPWPE